MTLTSWRGVDRLHHRVREWLAESEAETGLTAQLRLDVENVAPIFLGRACSHIDRITCWRVCRKRSRGEPAGRGTVLNKSGVDSKARQIHEVLHVEFGSLFGHISSVLGIEAEDDLVTGVRVNTGAQTWRQLPSVLVSDGETDAQATSLTKSVFEICGEAK